MPLTLTSPAFADNEFFPIQYTCDGDNISPSLTWSEVPGGTQVYWVLYGLDPASGGIEEGKVPASAVGGKNDYGRTGTSSRCLPSPARSWPRPSSLVSTPASGEEQ
jgi:phosphatidylethanolamine-binding protein (PEBP) family uncharacterized protein